MDLDQLRSFVAVARAGTFTRAAEQEGVTQPSLSQQVRNLETCLGVPLFERRGRSTRLTQAGEHLLPQARALLRQASETKRSVNALTNRVCGPLAIGAIPTVMPYWLAPRIADFQAKCPEVDVRLVEGLQEGQIDVALLSLPLASPDVVCSELFRDELLFVLPPSHPLAARPHMDPSQISGERLLVLREGHCLRHEALAVCRRGLRDPGAVFESDQFSSVFALVASGFGITVAPKM